MKEGRIQECIDYIRFSMDIEGASLSEELETVLREILEEERTAGSAAGKARIHFLKTRTQSSL